MKFNPSRLYFTPCACLRVKHVFIALVISAVALVGWQAQAATFTYNQNTATAQSWNASANWNPSSGTYPNNAGDVADLNNNITNNSTLNLNGNVTLGILNIGDTDDTNTFTIAAGAGGTLTMNNNGAGAQINESAGTKGDTISAGIIIADAGGLTVTTSATSSNALTISGSITGTGNLTFSDISSGGAGMTVSGSVNNTGTITVSGTPGGAPGVIFSGGIGPNVTAITSSGSFLQTIIQTGNLTVNSGGTTLTNAATTNKFFTVSSNVVGTGNLILNTNSGTGGVSITGTANNIGTITNSGTGAVTTTITTGGTNVTGYLESSTSSALTVTTLNVNSAGTTLTNSAGSAKPLTVSGAVVGTGNLILDNNSATASGITISGTANLTSGNIINSGTGTGSVAISGTIASGVGSVMQNSATSTLALTGTSTWTGGLFINAGIVSGAGAAGNFGAGTITLGTNGVSAASATLLTTSNGLTYLNPITVQAGSTGTLTIDGSTNSQAFSGNIALNNNLTVVNSTAAKITTLSGSIVGSGNITIGSGNLGTVALTGSSPSYSGTTSIVAGTLNFANGALGSGSVAFGGGTLQYATGNTQDLSGSFSNTSSAVSIDVNGNAVNFGRVLGSGLSGGLTLASSTSGTGSLTLNGTQAYTGLTTVNSGTLKLGATSGIAGGNALNTAVGGIFDINGNSQTLGAVVNTGTITNSGAGTPTLTLGNAAGASAGAATGLYSGAMNVIWNEGATNSTFSGTFTNTGTVTLNATGAGTLTAGTVDNNGNLILNANGATTGVITVTLANNAGTITNSGNGAVAATAVTTVGSNVTGIIESDTNSSLTVGTLTVNANGTTLTNNNFAAPNKPISITNAVVGSGNLILDNNGNFAAGIVLVGGASLTSGTIINSGTGSGPSSVTITGAIGTGVGAVIQNGTNSVLNLNGTNLWTGGLFVNSGTVTTTAAAGFGGTGGAITLGTNGGSANAALLSTANGLTHNNNITVQSGDTGTLTIDGSAHSQTFSGNIALNNNLAVLNSTAAMTTTFSGSIIGSGNITVGTGNLGIVAITGANTSYSGTTNVNVGTLNFTNGALGTGSVTFGGGLLQYASGNTQDISSQIVSSGNAITIDLDGNPVVFANPLAASNNGGLTLTSSTTGGSLTLTGSQGYTGLTTVTSGTLKLGASSSLSSGDNLAVATAGTFDLNGNNQTLGTVTLGNNGAVITNSGSSLTLNISNGLGAGNAGSGFNGAMTIIVSENSPAGGNNYQGYFNTTGNITLNVNGANVLTIAGTGTANNIGTITNSGTGAGSATVGNVGSNVTALIEDSASSQFDVGTSMIVNANGTTLSDLLTGGQLITSGSIGGTGNLLLQNNTATNAGVSLTTGTINLSGTIINSGSGTGSVQISDVVASPVAKIVEDSSSSGMVLSGASTFSGGVFIQNGLVSVSSTTGLGSGTAVLGDVSGTNSATLIGNGTTLTYANNILVQAGSSGTLTLGVTGSKNDTFSGNIALNNNLTLSNNVATFIETLSGSIVGSGNITIGSANLGIVAITGSSPSYSGTTTINSGILNFGNGSLGTGPVIFGASTTLQWATGNTQDISANTIASGSGITGTLDLQTNNVTFATANGLTGSGTITKLAASTGILTLSASNNFSGVYNTAVGGGATLLKNANALQAATVNLLDTANADGILFQPGVGTFTFGALSGAKPITLSDTNATPGAITLDVGNNNSNFSYTGVASGNGNLVKVGTGALTLSGASTFSGGVTVSSGTVIVATNPVNTGGSITTSPIGTGTLTLANNSAFISNLQLGPFTNSVAVTGTNITLGGSGVLSFDVKNSGTASPVPTFTTVAGANWTLVGSGTTDIGDSINFTAASGTSLTVGGNGTLFLFGNNNFGNGAVVVNSGTLQVGWAAFSGYNNGTTNSNPTNTNVSNWQVNGPGVLSFIASSGTQSQIWGGGTITLNNGGTLSYNDVNAGPIFTNTVFVTGSSGVLNINLPTNQLNTNPTPTIGSIVISAPLLTVNNTAGNSEQQENWTVSSSGSAVLENNVTINAYDISGSINKPVYIRFNGGISDDSATSGTARSLTVTGTGGNIAGGGRVVINGASTYTGSTSITNGGILNLAATNSLPDTAVYLDSTGVLDLNSAVTGNAALTNQRFAGLSGSGTVTTWSTYDTLVNAGHGISINSGTVALTFDDTNVADTYNFAGSLNDSGTSTVALSIVKSGSSTQILSGSNNYRGTTTINGGTLLINGNNANSTGAVAVNGGGTLGGIGTIGGAVTLASGTSASTRGTINLQDGAIGTLTLNNGLTIGSGGTSNLMFDLGGSLYDQLDVTAGNITETGTGVISVDALSALTLTSGSGNYILITGTNGLGNGHFTLASSTLTVGATTYTLSLANSTSTQEILTVTGSVAGNPASAFWTGSQDGNWNTLTGGINSNFNTDASSNINTGALPGSTTNVVFTTGTPTPAHLSTTLGQNFTINSLTFNANSSAVTISGSTLTINATGTNSNTPGNGIMVTTGAANDTINSNVALGGNQTWTVADSGNILTVSGNISDGGSGFSLTKAGAGTLVISGSASYSGTTGVNAGALEVDGSLSGSSAVTVNAATLQGTGVVGGPVALTGSSTLRSSGNLTLTSGFSVSGSANTLSSGTITGNATQNAASAFMVNGTLSGSDALTAGASLSGTGFVGVTTLNGTDNLSSAGTLTVTSLLVNNGGNTISSGTVDATGGTTLNTNSGLAVNGTLEGTVAIGSGATLSGTGTVTAGVTVGAGGVTSPGGTAPGVMTTDLAYSAGSTANFNVASSGSAAPQALNSHLYYSQIIVTGGSGAVSLGIGTGVTLGANSATSVSQTNSQIVSGTSTSGVTLQLTISSADYATLVANKTTNYEAKAGNTGLDNYFVFNLGSTLSTGRFTALDLDVNGVNTSGTIYYAGALDRFAADGVGNTIGDVYIGTQEFALSYTGVFLTNSTLGGNDIVLTAIPEPGTWGMILGGFGMLIGFQRLRKRRMD